MDLSWSSRHRRLRKLSLALVVTGEGMNIACQQCELLASAMIVGAGEVTSVEPAQNHVSCLDHWSVVRA